MLMVYLDKKNASETVQIYMILDTSLSCETRPRFLLKKRKIYLTELTKPKIWTINSDSLGKRFLAQCPLGE